MADTPEAEIDLDKLRLHYVEATKGAETRTRNIFVGSVLLSALVLLNLTVMHVRQGALADIVCISFPPVLLWSLAITGYAFYSLWGISNGRGRLLEKIAVTDVKTGLRSLDYVKALLQRECERASQTKQPLAVLYVDLVSLDRVNLQFGHAVGDIVLKEVAERIAACVPDQGVVGRVTGDEFVVVMPETKSEKARSVAAAVEKAITDYKLHLGKRGCVDVIRCRIGVIARSKDAGYADEIMSMAQMAATKTTRGDHIVTFARSGKEQWSDEGAHTSTWCQVTG